MLSTRRSKSIPTLPPPTDRRWPTTSLHVGVVLVAVALATAAGPAPARGQQIEATPRAVDLDHVEAGALLFRTAEAGSYVEAPAVATHVEMDISGLVARVQVGDVDEVGERMDELLAKLEQPVLTDIDVTLDHHTDAEIWPDPVPDLYRGEPVVVVLRLSRAQGEARVSGVLEGQPWQVSLPLEGGGQDEGIAAVWARQRIVALMDGLHEGADPDEVREEVTRVALSHGLVSAYTSLVALDVTPSRPDHVDVTSAAVPVNMPAGWNLDAVFGADPPQRVRWASANTRSLRGSSNGPAADQAADVGGETLVDMPRGGTAVRSRLALGLMALLAAAAVAGLGRRGRRG